VLALDILGFVEKVLPLFLNSLGWRQLEGVFFFFFSAFLGLMGLMLRVVALMWSHQVTGL
jgi:hypothetical protein